MYKYSHQVSLTLNAEYDEIELVGGFPNAVLDQVDDGGFSGGGATTTALDLNKRDNLFISGFLSRKILMAIAGVIALVLIVIFVIGKFVVSISTRLIIFFL